MTDTIGRAAAIGAMRDMCEECDSSYCGECRVNFPGRKDSIKVLEELPSAQPEIIYCRECKWKQGAECVMFADVRPFPDDFCSRAERSKEQ